MASAIVLGLVSFSIMVMVIKIKSLQTSFDQFECSVKFPLWMPSGFIMKRNSIKMRRKWHLAIAWTTDPALPVFSKMCPLSRSPSFICGFDQICYCAMSNHDIDDMTFRDWHWTAFATLAMKLSHLSWKAGLMFNTHGTQLEIRVEYFENEFWHGFRKKCLIFQEWILIGSYKNLFNFSRIEPD